MSGSIKIRVRSGRKTYALEVRNVDPEEKNHNIQIVLPEPSEPTNDEPTDDDVGDDEAERAIGNFLEQIMGGNLQPQAREPEMPRRPRAQPLRRNVQSGRTRERNQERRNARSEPADATIVENPSNLNRVSSEQTRPDDAKTEDDMPPLVDANEQDESKETLNPDADEETDEETPNPDADEETDEETDEPEDLELTADPDAQQEENDNDDTFMTAIQQAIVQSMTGRPIAEEQKGPSVWNITTGDPQNPTQVVMRSGDPARPPIAFDTLVSGHPLINTIRQTKGDSLNFYKEIMVNFDTWIRSAMNFSDADTVAFTKTLDKMFGIYLLKFPRVISNENFSRMIRIMETPTQDETQATKETRERLKVAIIALKEGVLNEIVSLFDTPNCSCPRCAL